MKITCKIGSQMLGICITLPIPIWIIYLQNPLYRRCQKILRDYNWHENFVFAYNVHEVHLLSQTPILSYHYNWLQCTVHTLKFNIYHVFYTTMGFQEYITITIQSNLLIQTIRNITQAWVFEWLKKKKRIYKFWPVSLHLYYLYSVFCIVFSMKYYILGSSHHCYSHI